MCVRVASIASWPSAARPIRTGYSRATRSDSVNSVSALTPARHIGRVTTSRRSVGAPARLMWVRRTTGASIIASSVVSRPEPCEVLAGLFRRGPRRNCTQGRPSRPKCLISWASTDDVWAPVSSLASIIRPATVTGSTQPTSCGQAAAVAGGGTQAATTVSPKAAAHANARLKGLHNSLRLMTYPFRVFPKSARATC